MIEKIVRDYLSNLLTVPVYIGEKPNGAPTECVVIKVIDGGRIEHIDAVTLNIESYSTSLLKASQLNNSVKEKMFNITSVDDISASRCGGGGQSINTQTKTYSYECVFNLFYYG